MMLSFAPKMIEYRGPPVSRTIQFLTFYYCLSFNSVLLSNFPQESARHISYTTLQNSLSPQCSLTTSSSTQGVSCVLSTSKRTKTHNLCNHRQEHCQRIDQRQRLIHACSHESNQGPNNLSNSPTYRSHPRLLHHSSCPSSSPCLLFHKLSSTPFSHMPLRMS